LGLVLKIDVVFLNETNGNIAFLQMQRNDCFLRVARIENFIPNPFRINRIRRESDKEEITLFDAAFDLFLPILSAL